MYLPKLILPELEDILSKVMWLGFFIISLPNTVQA